jgi:hypothetical protein
MVARWQIAREDFIRPVSRHFSYLRATNPKMH